MRSFVLTQASALTSLVALASARYAQPFVRDNPHLVPRQLCVKDNIYSALVDYTSATPFCSVFISVPVATVTVDFTPTS